MSISNVVGSDCSGWSLKETQNREKHHQYYKQIRAGLRGKGRAEIQTGNDWEKVKYSKKTTHYCTKAKEKSVKKPLNTLFWHY